MLRLQWERQQSRWRPNRQIRCELAMKRKQSAYKALAFVPRLARLVSGETYEAAKLVAAIATQHVTLGVARQQCCWFTKQAPSWTWATFAASCAVPAAAPQGSGPAPASHKRSTVTHALSSRPLTTHAARTCLPTSSWHTQCSVVEACAALKPAITLTSATCTDSPLPSWP